MQALCFALFACAFNSLIGYGGLLSFGHALYFGWASYLAAHSAKVWGFPPELAIPHRHADRRGAWRGGGFAGDPPARHLLRHDHAGAGADDVLLRPADEIHRRARTAFRRAARQAVRLDRSRRSTNMYVTCWSIFLAGFLLIYRIIHSPFGEVLKAIRENEPRAISLGYKTDRYKLVAFVLSRRSPALPARPRRSCCRSPRSPTSTGRCRARWC
jgi:branched-chain amino acid transport system permease protein